MNIPAAHNRGDSQEGYPPPHFFRCDDAAAEAGAVEGKEEAAAAVEEEERDMDARRAASRAATFRAWVMPVSRFWRAAE
jgi:hypothetical protein